MGDSRDTKPRLSAGDRRSFLVFCAIAYGWTWLLWIPTLWYSARTGLTLPTIDAGAGIWSELAGLDLVVAVAFQLAVYGPLVGALLALLLTARERLQEWRRSLFRFNVPLRWYAFVALWPIALFVLLVALGSALGGGAPRLAAVPALGTLGVMLLTQLLTSGLEEPGWRGFGLPLLQRTHSFENAGWYLGLVWAGWHVPYVVYLNRDAPMWMLPLTLAGFTMSIIAMGYVHAWVYSATGSVPLNIGLHAWANVANTVAAAVQPNPLLPLITAGLTWAFAAWILRREKQAEVLRVQATTAAE